MKPKRVPAAFAHVVPAWLAKWAGRWPRFSQLYLQVDPRSLGFARMALSGLLVLDLLSRPAAPIWLKLPAAVVYVFLLLGFHTRTAHAFSLVAVVGFNGGLAWQPSAAMTLPLLCLWTLLLPLRLRFSADSLVARLRTPKEVRPEALAQRHLFAPSEAAITSLAVATIILFIVLVSATALAHLNWHSLGLAVACVLLLNPWGWQRSRIFAWLLSLAVAVSAGPPSITVVFLLFLPSGFWSWIARSLGPAETRRRIVYIDASCGVCFALSRLLARLDTYNLLTIVANDQPERPSDLSDELVQKTIVVDDPITHRRWLKAAAFAQIFAALPAGAPIAWLLRMPMVAWLADPAYDLFARNRTKVSTAFGMAACGLPQAPAQAGRATLEASQAGATETWLATAREAGAVLVFVAGLLLLKR